MNVNWLLGFIEGEGNFYINFGVRRKIISPKLMFQILLAERPVLNIIQTFLATQEIKANIYIVRTKRRYGNLKNRPRIQKDHWLLQIAELSSIHKLIELLSPLAWYSDKLSSFKGWKEALKLAYPRPCTKDRIIKIAEIAEYLGSTNKGKRRWAPQFIEENCLETEDGRVKLML